MVRYKAKYYTEENERVSVKGWVAAHDMSEAAKRLEEHYGVELDELTLKLYENYDLDIIEDNYIETAGEGKDIE